MGNVYVVAQGTLNLLTLEKAVYIQESSFVYSSRAICQGIPSWADPSYVARAPAANRYSHGRIDTLVVSQKNQSIRY